MDPIKVSVKDTVVINSPGSNASLDELLLHISKHIDLWHDSNVIWDMRDFNFQNINLEDLKQFLENSREVSKRRIGKKTAILVGDDFGYEMMLAFSEVAQEYYQFLIKPFKDLKDAEEWGEGN